MFARAFGGFFGGTATVTAAFIVDLYPESKRAGQFARLGGALLAAFVFGPFVGGGLAQFGLRVPFFAAAGLSFVAMAAALIFVQNPIDLPGSEVSRKFELAKKKKDDGDSKVRVEESKDGIQAGEVELVELGKVDAVREGKEE